MRISSIALGMLAAVASTASAASASVQISQQAGISLTVEDDGSFEITSRIPAWAFAGKVDSPLVDLTSRQGKDLAGGFRKVEFKYQTSEGARLGAVRVYDHRPVVLFKMTFLTPGRTTALPDGSDRQAASRQRRRFQPEISRLLDRPRGQLLLPLRGEPGLSDDAAEGAG
jgi:hypothetical protein